MQYHPSDPRPYRRRGKLHPGRWEIDLRGMLDNGLVVERERRVFPLNPSEGKIGKRQAAAMAREEFERWNRHGQVLRPGEKPALPRTGAMTTGTAPTVAQFVDDYLDQCASPTLGRNGANAAGTLESKRSLLSRHIVPTFGSMRLDQIHRRDIEQYVASKTKSGRSLGTICNDLACLRHMITLAKRHDLIDRVPDFTPPANPPSSIVALSPDEATRFGEAIRKHFSLPQVTLLELYRRAGLRRGEALPLRPIDFDLGAQPTVQVSRSFRNHRFGPTKSRTVRLVPLAKPLVTLVDQVRRARGLSHHSSELLFPSTTSAERPVAEDRVFALVKRAAKVAELDYLRTHMLRHTFGTDCARRGVPLLTIKEWMGHADVKVTMRYLHLVAPDHLRWASVLDE